MLVKLTTGNILWYNHKYYYSLLPFKKFKFEKKLKEMCVGYKIFSQFKIVSQNRKQQTAVDKSYR